MNKPNRTILLVWLISLAGAVALSRFHALLSGLTGASLVPLALLARLTTIFVAGLTVYLVVVFVRFVLRRLFWRVGRRLALSYFLIGILPFFFFAVLVLVIGYLGAGVLSQASLKIERVTSLSALDQWNLQYVISGERPPDAAATLEIIDSDEAGESIPDWLRGTRLSGLARRDGLAVMVSSRVYGGDEGEPRTVVLVQPIDDAWAKALHARTGMLTAATVAETTGGSNGNLKISIDDAEGKEQNFDEFFAAAFRAGGVIWGDISPTLREWETGEVLSNTRVLTMLSNPWRNLLSFYMGDSQYVRWIGVVIVTVMFALGVVYLFATLLASWLIFSISRAVNRIEKASKAVERGDFSHRIAMRPTSQIGEVAQSFDRMTESIGNLLHNVAEKERLQSELDIAATIQRNMLPLEGPRFPGVSFAAHFEPTAAIGGDYYDVFNLSSTRLAVAIGDVSGHGLSTGLVMAMVKAAMTTLVQEGFDETSLFVRLNDLVAQSTDSRTFMTLGFTIFDLENATIRHTNAGHLYPYVLKAGRELIQIEAPALPLGVRKTIQTQTVEMPLESGDTLVYLSDGIVEAQNALGDPFGFERMEQILGELAGSEPNAIRNAILSALRQHCGVKGADDDRTIMILTFDGRATY